MVGPVGECPSEIDHTASECPFEGNVNAYEFRWGQFK